MASFERLPSEVLYMIIQYIEEKDFLLNLSCVNRRFRLLTIPHIFGTLDVEFTLASFSYFQQLSKSHIACYIKTIRYKAPELVDPESLSWDYFRSCVYTPTEYVRDRKEFCWSFRGKQIPYHEIYSYFNNLAREQHEIISNDIDLMILRECFPRLSRLQNVELVFVDNTKHPFQWFAGRMFVDWRDSFPGHFDATIEGMIAARRHGITIRRFSVSGLYSELPIADTGLYGRVVEALHSIESLQLTDSPTLLGYMTTVPLPSLRRIELASCWLWAADIEIFIGAHAKTVRVLHLEDIWFPVQRSPYLGIDFTRKAIQGIVEEVSTIRGMGVLQEITINRTGPDAFEYRETLEDGL